MRELTLLSFLFSVSIRVFLSLYISFSLSFSLPKRAVLERISERAPPRRPWHTSASFSFFLYFLSGKRALSAPFWSIFQSANTPSIAHDCSALPPLFLSFSLSISFSVFLSTQRAL